MNNVNRMTFERSKFVSDEERWEAVLTQIKFLVKTENIMRCVYDKASDTFIIDYIDQDMKKLKPYPYFLLPIEAGVACSAHEALMAQEYVKLKEQIDSAAGISATQQAGVDAAIHAMLDGADIEVVEDEDTGDDVDGDIDDDIVNKA